MILHNNCQFNGWKTYKILQKQPKFSKNHFYIVNASRPGGINKNPTGQMELDHPLRPYF
jgi:hypothetical protein